MAESEGYSSNSELFEILEDCERQLQAAQHEMTNEAVDEMEGPSL